MGGVGGPDHVRVASLQRLLADEHLTDARLRSSLSGATATSHHGGDPVCAPWAWESGRLDRRYQMTTLHTLSTNERIHLGAGSMSYEQLSS